MKKFLLTFFVISSISLSSNLNSEIPKWFFEPARTDYPGALGFASSSFYGDSYSFLIAECRAIKSLLNLINIKKKIFTVLRPFKVFHINT